MEAPTVLLVAAEQLLAAELFYSEALEVSWIIFSIIATTKQIMQPKAARIK